ITRINNSDSIYLSATLHSSIFDGLFCLSIYASKGDIQFPKISNIPNLNFYSNPVLIANGNDRLLSFNAGSNQNDITGYLLKLDDLFQFSSGIKLKDTTKIHSILSLENDGYIISLGDRLVSKITKNLSFDYVYSLDSNYTHFDHNLEKYQDNIILLGDYNKNVNSNYFTLINFDLNTKKTNKFDKLIQYTKSLTPKLIHYGNQLVGIDNVAVSHISIVSDTQSIQSISLFSNEKFRNTNSYRPSQKYTSLCYGLDFLPMESNLAMAGCFQDTFRYFSAKLNHKGSVTDCDFSNFIDTTSIDSFKLDSFSLLQSEATSSPIINSTIKQVNFSIQLKRKCNYFDFMEGPTSIQYCKGINDTFFVVSAIAKDPISYSNPFVRYSWSTGATTQSITVNSPYKKVDVTTTYCSEVKTLSYSFEPVTCDLGVNDSKIILTHCEGKYDTSFLISALDYFPNNNYKNKVKFIWSNGKTTESILVIKPYDPISVTYSYGGSEIKKTFEFKSIKCSLGFDTTYILYYCQGNMDTTFAVSALDSFPNNPNLNLVKYIWSTNDTSKSIMVKKPYKSVFVTYSYKKDSLNSKSVTYFEFKETDCFPPVLFPNVFTPASDIPENKGYSMVIKDQSRIREAEWSIYNRWGAKVFSSNEIVDDWDGTYKGNPAPSETYVVNAIVTDINGISKSFSEMFTLVR
ncbi:MAG: T9SS type B sorting domain-containing protein, partial [Saprospiraceae bacterium]